MFSYHHPYVDCTLVFWGETVFKNCDVVEVGVFDIFVPTFNASVKETAKNKG